MTTTTRKKKSAARKKADRVASKLKRPRKSNTVRDEDRLKTGSTLLDLAGSGSLAGGFAMGKYHFVVGDSESGKTFLAMTCLAEAARNPEFKNHRFVLNNVEDGALMDIGKFFGSKVASRLEMRGSETIEEFYYDLDDCIEDGRPFIYILDSMDALSSDAEHDKFKQQKEAHRKGTESAGSMSDGKAKKNSANLRRVIGKLRKTKSILILINQTRDNLGFGFEKKTRSGGKSLKFYATLEIWSSIVKTLKRNVNGTKHSIGIICRIEVKKNRYAGRHSYVEFPIYHSTGIDDIGSCVDFLIKEKHWKKRGGVYAPPEFDFKGNREKLVRLIEANELEDDLREIVASVWKKIEEALTVNRKKRYD